MILHVGLQGICEGAEGCEAKNAGRVCPGWASSAELNP